MYIAKIPRFVQRLFPSFVWRMPTAQKIIYLTFDDGPTPYVTNWVLQQLAQYEAKATFFCIGKHAVEHPEICQQVLTAGHTIGNHTYNHLNGWQTPTDRYIFNVKKCQEVMPSATLFRPPYGKITPRQAAFVQDMGLEVVLFDVICGDFDQQLTPEKGLQNVLKNVEPGSILVFHDSPKALRILAYVLPKVLEYFSVRGYRFELLY